MFFTINKEEMNLLAGIPYFYQLLYIYLRSKVDRASGLVGAKKGQKISLKAISEWLYVEPSQGIKNSGSPSIKKIRVALKALECSGLLKSRSIATKDKKQLILFLPYALQDNSAQKKEGMNGARKQDVEEGLRLKTQIHDKQSNSVNLNENIGTEVGVFQTQKVGTPQKNNNIYTHTICDKKNKNFILPNYQPSTAILQKATELGINQFHSPLELQKFIAYYQGNGIASADWDSHYLRWLINSNRFQQQNQQGEKNAKRQPRIYRTRETLSAPEQGRQRNHEISKNQIIDVEADNKGQHLSFVAEIERLFRS